MPEELHRSAKHWEAILWVNELIADLKLQLNERQPITPITIARLEEWRGYRNDLEACKRGGNR